MGGYLVFSKGTYILKCFRHSIPAIMFLGEFKLFQALSGLSHEALKSLLILLYKCNGSLKMKLKYLAMFSASGEVVP